MCHLTIEDRKMLMPRKNVIPTVTTKLIFCRDSSPVTNACYPANTFPLQTPSSDTAGIHTLSHLFSEEVCLDCSTCEVIGMEQ